MKSLRTLFICISILCSVFSPVYATRLVVPLSANAGLSISEDNKVDNGFANGFYSITYNDNGTFDTVWAQNGHCTFISGGGNCLPSTYAHFHVPKNATRGELELGIKKKDYYPLEIYKNGVQQIPPIDTEWFLQLGYTNASGHVYNNRSYGVVVPNTVGDVFSHETCAKFYGSVARQQPGWATEEKEYLEGYKVYSSGAYQDNKFPCIYTIDFSDMNLSEMKDFRIRLLSGTVYVAASVFQDLPAGSLQGKIMVDDYATVRYYDANDQLLSTENLFDEVEVNLNLLLAAFFKFDIVDGDSIHLTFVDGKDDVVRGVSIFNIQTNMSKTYYSITCPIKTTDGRCGLKNSNGSVLPLNLKYLQTPSDSYLSAQPLMPDKIYSNVDDLKGAAVLRNNTFGLLLELNKKDISGMSDKDGLFEGTVILTAESSID